MRWRAVGAVAVALAAGAGIAATALTVRRRARPRVPAGRSTAMRLPDEPRADAAHPLVAVIANPVKPGVAALQRQVAEAAAARGWPEPLWLETTPQDPGIGQARRALAAGASLVIAAGGDGTARAVAEALTHTGVPMGLLPQGTGNLFARNLDLPLGHPTAALSIALDGADRRVDVGRLHVDRWADDDTSEAPGAPDDHLFLVIGGVGLDAAMVADTDEQLKARLGWLAYFLAGARHLRGHRLRLRVQVDDEAWAEARARSLLVGNVGRLPGGLTLLPEAQIDDGWLDLAAIDVRGGIAGWAQLLGEVMLQGIGVRDNSPVKIGRIDHVRARRARVQITGDDQVQVDGESLGRVRELSAWVDPAALVVRVAAPRA